MLEGGWEKTPTLWKNYLAGASFPAAWRCSRNNCTAAEGVSDLNIPVNFQRRGKGGKGTGGMPLKAASPGIIVLKLGLRQSRTAI